MELRRWFRVRSIFLLATVLQISAAVFGVSILLESAATDATTQTIPYLINFQGRLTDNNGNVLSDGSYNIKFRIFNASSGGTNEWEGDRVDGTSDDRVTVQNGLFNIQFGDATEGDPALSPSLFTSSSPLYLEVELPTPATATCATNGCAVWTEGAMTPRQPLASSPYAFNSDTLDGLDSSAFGQLSANQSWTNTNTFSKSGGAGIVLSGTAAGGGSVLQIGSALSSGNGAGTLFGANTTSSGDLLNLQVSSVTKLQVDNSGNITDAGNFQYISGINHSLAIAPAASGAGNDLSVVAGQSGSGLNNGGSLYLEAGATGGTGTTGSVIVKANGTDSASAFQIQNAGGNPVLVANTLNSSLAVNVSASSGTLTIKADALHTVTQVYSISGTSSLTLPTDVTSVTVKAWGAGGGGGAGSGGTALGGSGGGGGFAQASVAAAGGSALSIDVGSGGPKAGTAQFGGAGGGYSAVRSGSTFLVQAGAGGGGGGALNNTNSAGSGGAGGGASGIVGGNGAGTGPGLGGQPGTVSAGGLGGTGGSGAGAAGILDAGGDAGGSGATCATNSGNTGAGGTGAGGAQGSAATCEGGGGGGGGNFGGGGGGSANGNNRGAGGGGGGSDLVTGSGTVETQGAGTAVANNTDSDYLASCAANAGKGGIGATSIAGNTFGNAGCVVVTYQTATNNASTLDVQDSSGNDTFKVLSNGNSIFRNTSDNTAAFQIQNASGTPDLTLDTLNNKLSVGTLAASGNITGGGNITLASGADRTESVGASGAGVAGNALNLVAGSSGSGAVNGGNLVLQAGASGGSGITGSIIAKANGTDSATAFQVQQASGAPVLTIDSTNNKVIVGDASGINTNTSLLVVDSATQDPATGYNGSMYYNTTSNTFRCYQAGAWANCISSTNITVSDDSTGSFTSGLANVAANTAGQTAEMLVFTTATAVSNVAGPTGFTAPAAGSFRSCLVKNNALITAGTVSLRWRVNGVSVGSAACNLNSTTARQQAATALDNGVVTFNAGDTLGIAFDSSAGYTPVTDDYTAYWTVEYNSTTGNGLSEQFVYDSSSSPATTNLSDGKDLVVNAADTATDPNDIINLQCVTSCGSNGRFAVQNGGVDALVVSPNNGGIALNQNTTIGSGKNFTVTAGNATLSSGNLTLTSGSLTQNYTATTASNGQSLAFTNNNTAGAGVAIQGINITPANHNPASGTNTLNGINFAAGSGTSATAVTNGINFASSTGYTNYLTTPTATLNTSGDLTSSFINLGQSSTTNGTGAASTTLILNNATGFVTGNYVQVNSANCGGAGINPCYAKITNIATNTLTITPALTWANGATVNQYHLPEIGGVDTSQALANRYGRGYFIAGVATGNGTTFYDEDGITSSLATYNLLSSSTDAVSTLNFGNTSTANLNLGGAGTTVAVPGTFTVDGQSIVNGSGQINGAQLQAGTVANGALANSSLTVATTGNLTGGGSVSLGGTITVNTIANPTFSTSVTTPIVDNAGTLSVGASATSFTLGKSGVTAAFAGSLSVATFAAATSTPVCSNAGVLSTCSGVPSSTTLNQAYTNGNTISTSGNDIAFTLNSSQNFTVTTAAGATGSTTFALANGTNATPPAQLVLVTDQDTNDGVTAAIKVTSSGGTITNALDASGTNITNALNIGANAIAGSNFSVTGAGAVTGGTYNGQTIAAGGSTFATSATSPIINASTTLELGGTNINTGGATPTLSDVDYLDSAQSLTATKSFTKSGGSGIVLSGTAASAGAQLQFGSVAGLNGGSTNGTYLGANPATYTGDFINFAIGSVNKLKVDNSGNLTAAGTITGGTYNGQTIAAGGSTFATSATSPIINASTTLEVGGANVNTGGGTPTLSDVDYLDSATSQSASKTFAKSGGQGIILSGTAASGGAQLQFGSVAALGSGNANGTYIGANPATYTGDFVNLQIGSAVKFKVDNTGNATLGGGLTIGSGTVVTVGASAGQTSTVSCSANQAVTAAIFTGGILTTAPTCSAITGTGATTTLNNLGTTSIDADLLADTTLTRSLGSATDIWKNLFISNVDTQSTTNTALTVGTTNATSIQIGKSGVAPSFPGGLTTSGGAINAGAGTITSGAVNGQTIAAAASFGTSVTAPTINGSTALQVGGASINTGGGTPTLSDVDYLDSAQSISATKSLTKSGGAGAIFSGTAASTGMQLQFGSVATLSGGSTNGTYIGADPATYTGDFLNLQVNNAVKFKVDNTGNVTAGGGLTIASGSVVTVGATAGVGSTVSCSANQAVTAAIFTGGVLTTAPTCSAITGTGATTTLNNLGTTAIDADLLPDVTLTRSLGSATDIWKNLFVSNIDAQSATNTALTVGTAATTTAITVGRSGFAVSLPGGLITSGGTINTGAGSITSTSSLNGGTAVLGTSVSSPTYTGTGAVTVESTGANALTLATQTSGQNVNISPNGTGTVVVGGTTPTITSAGAITLQAASSSALNINTSGTGATNITPGTGGLVENFGAGVAETQTATAAMTADLFDQTNTSATNAPTADGINLLQQTFFGKPSGTNNESSTRINITNSNTAAGGQVNGLRIVATGAGGAIASDTDGIFIDPLANSSTGTTNENAIEVGANWDAGFLIQSGGNTINATSATALNIKNATLSVLTVDTSADVVNIGSGDTSDANQVLLNLDSFSTFADTASCTGGTNQGALYYSTNTNAIRACVNNNWEDVVTTSGLGILTFGVIPDSANAGAPGDVAGITNYSNSPCKVVWGSATSVIAEPCTAYSGGRKVIVAQTTINLTTGNLPANDFANICLTGAGNQPAIGTANATETTAAHPAFSANNPILCLATIKASATAGDIGFIWDTRTFTNTQKEFATVDSISNSGFLVIGTTTAAMYQVPTTTAATFIRGVIVATTGTASTNTINAIIAVKGPAYVKFISGGTATINNVLESLTTTAGYGTSVAGTAAVSNYIYGGPLETSISTSCTTQNTLLSACQYSPLIDFGPSR